MRNPSLILASVLVAGLAVSATAEEVTLGDSQVPFAFAVGSTQLPVGHYQILSSGPGESVLIVRNLDTGKTTLAEFITRIAPRGDGKSVLVFDAAEGQRFLSEIHLSGHDGYLLLEWARSRTRTSR